MIPWKPGKSWANVCANSTGNTMLETLLSMFDSVRNYAQGQRFRLSDRFFTTLPILQYTGNLRNLGDPSTVFFPLCLHCELH